MAPILLTCIIGCGDDYERGSLEEARIFSVGDSIFEWNLWERASAPEILGEDLELPVYNAAISGAMMTDDSPHSIPNQYVTGDWDWLVMDGGANDLNERCGCSGCEALQDELEDVFRSFVQERLAEGVSVAIWGYYGLPSDASYGFDRCGEELEELGRRQQLLAESDPGIIWVDGSLEITGEDSAAFDEDKLHPSMEGSQRIGRQLAEAIQAEAGF